MGSVSQSDPNTWMSQDFYIVWLYPVQKWWKSLKLFYIKWHVLTAELNRRERNFTFSWLALYSGTVVRIQNRVSACICIFNVWPAWTLQPYGHSGHLVRYLDIYDYSGVLPDTFSSPSVKMSKSSRPVIWSVALHRPELSMGDSSGGLTTAHLGQI